ncbi:hypothetical protein U0070_014057, partial [Myodes glareolus]
LFSLNPQFPPSRYDARVTLCPSRPQLDLALTWNTWKPTVSSVSRNWGLVQKVSDRREGGGVPSLPQPPPQLTSQGPAGLTSTGLAPAGVETSHPAALEDVDVPASASRAGAQHLRAQ